MSGNIRGEKRSFEADVSRNQRRRLDSETDRLSDLEMEFSQLDRLQTNYDLVRRIETLRSENLSSLAESPLRAFSERVSGWFSDTATSRIENLYISILTRHGLEPDYAHHIERNLSNALGDRDIPRIMFFASKASSSLREASIETLARRGDAEILQALLNSAPISLHCKEKAIIDVANEGYLDALRILLTGGDFISHDAHFTALQKASEKGHLEIIKSLLAHQGIIDELGISDDERGQLAHESLKKGHLEIVKTFLEHGNFSDMSRGLVFVDGAEGGHLDIIEALLQKGTIENYLRGEAVKKGASKGHSEVVAFLLANGEIWDDQRGEAIIHPAQHGHLGMVRQLLNSGPIYEIHRSDAVRHAAINGHFEIIRELLNNATIPSEARERAAREALQQGYEEIAEFLVPGARARFANTHHLSLSFEGVTSNPDYYLDHVIGHGFPSRIDLLLADGSYGGVIDHGGVRKGFLTHLFKTLHPLLGLDSKKAFPLAKEASQKVLYTKIGQFLSKLDITNEGKDDPFLIGSFFPERFYELLKLVASLSSSEELQTRLAAILQELDPNFEILAKVVENPSQEHLQEFADIYGIESDEAYEKAIELLSAYLEAARSFIEGCSEELKQKIITKSYQTVARAFQGESLSKESLKTALVTTGSSPHLEMQLEWIKEKIDEDETTLEWCRKFTKWATECEAVSLSTKITLTESAEQLFAHTCHNSVDVPASLNEKELLLAAIDAVLEGPLNSL